jgi:hypothetical protein
MFISPAEALRLYAVSKPTLYSDMKDGKLSYQVDDRDKRRINVAELDRLYEKRPEGTKHPGAVNVQDPVTQTELNGKDTTHLVAMLNQKIEHLDREVRARGEDADKWREAFEKAQATADKITALIEDRSLGARHTRDHDEKIDKLTTLVEQQVEEASNQYKKMQNKRLLTTLEGNKNTGFFKRFFTKEKGGGGGEAPARRHAE